MQNKKYLFIIGIVTLILFVSISTFIYSKKSQKNSVYVKDFILNNVVVLADGTRLQLAGIYIPSRDHINYRTYLEEKIVNIVKNKTFYVKIIEKAKERYPKYDLVLLYADVESNVSLNEELLIKGMAFFDHGYYDFKGHFEDMERSAKVNQYGIWKEKDSLKLMFVTSRDWRGFHYPECPEVEKINEREKIEYYFLPQAIFYYRYPETSCAHCRDIEIKNARPKLFTYSEEDYLKDVRDN